MDKVKLKPVIDKAIEIYASSPMIQHKDVATMLNVSDKTLRKIRRDTDFQNKVYEYYMKTFDTDVVAVLKALISEAVAGNTTAGRIVLEHSGRLQNNLNVNVTKSPFQVLIESHVKYGNTTAEEAEIVMDQVKNRSYSELSELNFEIDEPVKIVSKNSDWNARRRELHKWKVRAKAVNIKPLPNHRVTKGQRAKWEESIVKAEGLWGV